MFNKIIIFLTVIFGIASGAFAAQTVSQPAMVEQTVVQKAPLITPTPQINDENLPVTLKIPKIEVDTKIEHVANDRLGNMDTPSNAAQVAWYKPGYIPGDKGNAVIAGHYDTESGPAIFADLSELAPGDEIEIVTKKGEVKRFVVEELRSFPADDFPIDEVFGKSDSANLNLITCTGEFNEIAQDYSERVVVSSRLL